MKNLKDALAEHGISHKNLSLSPGSDSKIPCPMAAKSTGCAASNPWSNDLSVTIDGDGEGATWKCHRGTCGGDKMTGGLSIRKGPSGFAHEEVRVFSKPKEPERQEQPDALLDYFEQRGIPAEVVKRNGIHLTEHWFYAEHPDEPKGGLMLPCIAYPYRRNGELVNIKYLAPASISRAFSRPERRRATKRFLQEKNAEKIFGGLDDIADTDWCIIVEGEDDKLAMEVAGYRNVLTVPDGAPERVQQVYHCVKCGHELPYRKADNVPVFCCDQEMDIRPAKFDPKNDKKFEYIWNCWADLKRMKKVYVAVDSDAPGHALSEELCRRIGKQKCWRVSWPEMTGDIQLKDAREVLVEMGREAVKQAIQSAKPYPINGLHSAEDFLGDLLAMHDGEVEEGLTTGFACLDRLMKLTGDGKLMVVTGIPSHGKSEFIDQLCMNYARNHEWPTAYCSFENPPKHHIRKLIEKYHDKPFRQLYPGGQEGMTRDEVREAVAWINDYFAFMTPGSSSPTVDWIMEKFEAAVVRYGIRLAVVDPFNRIEHSRDKNQTETEFVARFLDRFQRLGVAHGFDVIVIAHPYKLKADNEGKEPIPTPYDISGAAHWYNMPDWNITVWRDKADETQPVQFHVQKVKWKELGKDGMAEFSWRRSSGVYSGIPH